MNLAFISGSSWSFGQHFGKSRQFVGHFAHLVLASAGTHHAFFLVSSSVLQRSLLSFSSFEEEPKTAHPIDVLACECCYRNWQWCEQLQVTLAVQAFHPANATLLMESLSESDFGVLAMILAASWQAAEGKTDQDRSRQQIMYWLRAALRCSPRCKSWALLCGVVWCCGAEAKLLLFHLWTLRSQAWDGHMS